MTQEQGPPPGWPVSIAAGGPPPPAEVQGDAAAHAFPPPPDMKATSPLRDPSFVTPQVSAESQVSPAPPLAAPIPPAPPTPPIGTPASASASTALMSQTDLAGAAGPIDLYANGGAPALGAPVARNEGPALLAPLARNEGPPLIAPLSPIATAPAVSPVAPTPPAAAALARVVAPSGVSPTLVMSAPDATQINDASRPVAATPTPPPTPLVEIVSPGGGDNVARSAASVNEAPPVAVTVHATASSPTQKKNRRAIALLAILGFVVAAMAGVYFYLRASGPSEEGASASASAHSKKKKKGKRKAADKNVEEDGEEASPRPASSPRRPAGSHTARVRHTASAAPSSDEEAPADEESPSKGAPNPKSPGARPSPMRRMPKIR